MACACCCSRIISKQTITVNITYLVGSRHENYGETGMAHLLEHMLFKGTARRTDFPRNWRRTARVPTAPPPGTARTTTRPSTPREENLSWALDLEADRMMNSVIAKKDLDSEMTVVRNEFEMGENQPLGVLFKRLMSASYDWHNYGNSADRRALGHRRRADRSPAGVLPDLLPAGQRAAAGGRQDRRSEDAHAGAGVFRFDSEAHAHPAGAVHREPVQDGERS